MPDIQRRDDLQWPLFFEEMADRILEYKDRRYELAQIVLEAYKAKGLGIKPFGNIKGDIIDMDPFTVIALVNRNIKADNRRILATAFKDLFGIQAQVPMDGYPGVPTVNNQRSFFASYFGDETERIDMLWDLFESALAFSDNPTEENRQSFINAYGSSGAIWGGLRAQGLYWIRPYKYLTLDSRTTAYLEHLGIAVSIKLRNSITHDDGEGYLSLCEMVSDETGLSFPEISIRGYAVYNESRNEEIDDEDPESSGFDMAPSTGQGNDFMSDVYMARDDIDRTLRTLAIQKNIILQGPPGVGKSFIARRLAYALIGGWDDSRIETIQFHQSYSYEDFVMGFRPTETGFELKTGVFYDIVKRAEDDPDNDYVLIIEEINRGNLAKVFGELFTLIEADKRGQSMNLMYGIEDFSVPENLFIIGTMNTADRSLAMIDFAMRRRFGFVTMAPAFDSEGFKTDAVEIGNSHFHGLVEAIKGVNEVIKADPALGKDYLIGHSFVCGFQDDDNLDDDLRIVVENELVPLIDEYFYDDQARADELEELLRTSLR